MRLARRLLALLALIGSIIVLIRYRQDVESTIEITIETTFDAVAYELQAAEEEEEATKSRQLPQVILPFEKSDPDQKAVIAEAVENHQSTGDDVDPSPTSSPNPDANGVDVDVDVDVEPSTTSQGGASKGDHGSQALGGGEIKDAGAFWARWARAIYEARPRTPKITLAGHAQTQRPRSEETWRQPYRDHVRNSAEDVESLQRLHELFVEELEGELANDTGDEQKNGPQQRQWKGLDIFKGRGVVVVGGGEYFGPAIIGIHMLRRTGSSLPVEVFIPDDDEYEKQVCEEYLKKLDAKCVVLSHMLEKSTIKVSRKDDADLKITHYQLKSLALLLSSFSDVLLLDSDSIPLMDPTTNIFDSEPYQSKGMIIWPDFWRATESPKYWTIAGRSNLPSDLPATSSEAGQLAVNKATHLAPLLLATYYNVFGPDHYYPLQSQGALGQGDKETFMAAAVALNASYYRVQTPPGRVGRHDGVTEKGTAMIQHLPSDDMKHPPSAASSAAHNVVRPIFLHSNTPKMNAGHLVDEGDLIAKDGSRLRLLGSKESSLGLFGFDVERSVWDILVQTGCELHDSIEEWKERDKMCERLNEHYRAVFES